MGTNITEKFILRSRRVQAAILVLLQLAAGFGFVPDGILEAVTKLGGLLTSDTGVLAASFALWPQALIVWHLLRPDDTRNGNAKLSLTPTTG